MMLKYLSTVCFFIAFLAFTLGAYFTKKELISNIYIVCAAANLAMTVFTLTR